MGIGAAARPGAALGPHGEGDGDEWGRSASRRTIGAGSVRLAGCLFGGSGGGKR